MWQLLIILIFKRKNKMKKIAILAVGIAVTILFFLIVVYFWLVQPVTRGNEIIKIDFSVSKGEGVAMVAKKLEKQGLIKNAFAFRLLAKFTGEQGLVPGVFTLNGNLSATEVLHVLKTEPKELTITILPGWRREEIAEYLVSLSLVDFSATEFLTLTKDLEGQLMAETYQIYPNETTAKIVTLLHNQYLKDLAENEEIQALVRKSDWSFEEILIIASLLQREARDEEQMRQIAAIIYRRLDDNYPLELCATAQYAVGKNEKTNKWWDAPTLADTQFDSAYNTYRNKGLPPAPISAVSVTAVKAALAPATNDYYFYLHDSAGKIHYAQTLEEHNANKANYL
jgi:UPF0755 protein